MRNVRITLLALLAGEVLLLVVTGGWRMGAGSIEYAPGVPSLVRAGTGGRHPGRRTRPGQNVPSAGPRAEYGPWFVDRAHDLAMDVITICGSPDKPSILHSLGSGRRCSTSTATVTWTSSSLAGAR